VGFQGFAARKSFPSASGGAEFGAGNSRHSFRGKRKRRLREAIVAVEWRAWAWAGSREVRKEPYHKLVFSEIKMLPF
jgi:hypothetical protein